MNIGKIIFSFGLENFEKYNFLVKTQKYKTLTKSNEYLIANLTKI